MIIGHGGNIGHLARTLGCSPSDITDMSCNLNPLGPPDSIKQVICEHLEDICSLPEPDARSMCRGFAKYHGIPEENVVAGNGTTWFIYTLPQALKSSKALIVGPTYSDYKDACLMHGLDHEHFITSPDAGFIPDMDLLEKKSAEFDLVFICNPNNPTGALVAKELLNHLIQSCPDTIFVVDESYLPFAQDANSLSFVQDIQFENLLVLSSMSKIFRIPGLRTGFLSGSKALCEKIMELYQPWSVNALAQTVITHIYEHPQDIDPFCRQTRQFVRQQVQLFLKDLEGLDEIECFDTHTSFILARLTGKVNSRVLCDQVGLDRILIRDCENFKGLDDTFVRFSLKHRPENQHLSGLIRKILKNV